jgi:hypothetical protein
MCFALGGVQGREPAPPAAFEWASLGIYHLSEMREAFVDTMARFFCEEKGLQAQPFRSEACPLQGWFVRIRQARLGAGQTNPRPRQCSSEKLSVGGVKHEPRLMQVV